MISSARWVVGYIVAVIIGTASNATAYEEPTHEFLNTRALAASTLDRYLKENLKIDTGIDQQLPGGRISKLIADAGKSEDAGWRFLNHFHNPLKPWPVAGLNAAVPFIHGQSSLLWAQRAAGDSEQGWSWHDARDSFYQALTAVGKTEREQALANTFRAVGQVMHLIEDASVPAHVRNDAHPPVISGYHYETWAKTHQDELNTSPLLPAIDLTDAFLDEEFVPIYKLFDSDQYTGDNPAVTDSLSAGIAEYTNAHFFSDDTMFAEDLAPEDQHYFRHPSKASVDPIPWVDPLDDQQYLAEAREGGIQHVVLVSWLYRYRLVYFPEITKFLPVTIKDDLVFQEQAQHLVPRAVGYAAEALDYFFRGEIGLVKAPGQPGHFVIQNNSTEPLSGTFGLYYDDKDGIRHAVAD